MSDDRIERPRKRELIKFFKPINKFGILANTAETAGITFNYGAGSAITATSSERLFQGFKGLDDNGNLTQQGKDYFAASLTGGQLQSQARKFISDPQTVTINGAIQYVTKEKEYFGDPIGTILRYDKPVKMPDDPATGFNYPVVLERIPPSKKDTSYNPNRITHTVVMMPDLEIDEYAYGKQIKRLVMEDITRAKETQNPIIMLLLLETKNAELAEDVTSRKYPDYYWGRSFPRFGKPKGYSFLGKQLEENRAYYKKLLDNNKTIPVYIGFFPETATALKITATPQHQHASVVITGTHLEQLKSLPAVKRYLKNPTGKNYESVKGLTYDVVTNPDKLVKWQLNDEIKRLDHFYVWNGRKKAQKIRNALGESQNIRTDLDKGDSELHSAIHYHRHGFFYTEKEREAPTATEKHFSVFAPKK